MQDIIKLAGMHYILIERTVGMIHTYSTLRCGSNRWRDQRPPVQLLEEWYEQQSFATPLRWSHNKKRVKIGPQEYTLKDFGEFIAGNLIEMIQNDIVVLSVCTELEAWSCNVASIASRKKLKSLIFSIFVIACHME